MVRPRPSNRAAPPPPRPPVESPPQPLLTAGRPPCQQRPPPPPTPSSSSTSARSTPSSSPAASVRPGSTARSCRAPCRWRDARQEPEGDHPLRRPLVGLRRGRPAPGPRALRGRCPGLRHVLRLPADGDDPRRHRRQHRRPRVRPYPAERLAARLDPVRGHPRRAVGVDVARRRLLRRPRGLHRHRLHRRRPGRRLRERREEALRRPVPPRGHALHARPAGPGALPLPRRGHQPELDHDQRGRGAGRRDPRAGRHQARHLRAVRRRGLRGRRGPRAEGHRRPADLRLRRPRPDAQGRVRAGREGLRRRHRRPAEGRRRARSAS